MYHAINRDLLSFVCQLKKILLNIVWCLPPGTGNALRKEISIAALHMVWHDWLDQRLWMAAGCSWGARSRTNISVPEGAAQGTGGETLQRDFKGTELFFFFFSKEDDGHGIQFKWTAHLKGSKSPSLHLVYIPCC